jgi:cation:H+ antiporter
MLWHFFIFLVGLGILYIGAEWLVKAATQMALHYGIRPIVVGLTIVALGTSLPEFFINFFATFTGEHDLALGNIIGSNICNIALILGSSAMILPLAVKPQMLTKEYPLMLGAMVLFYLVALDGQISQWDGIFMVIGLLGVMTFLFIDAKRHPNTPLADQAADGEQADELRSPWMKTLYTVAGMIFLAGGAHLMVRGAVNMANMMGIDHVVIGLTIVAIGTSLPELAASMVGVIRQEADLSVGNVLGSNILNVLFVVGVIAIISPLEVGSQSLGIHFPVMLGFSVLILPLAWTQYCITRWEGGLLFAGFLGYMTYLILPYM